MEFLGVFNLAGYWLEFRVYRARQHCWAKLYHAGEKNKVQGVHDFILFTLVAMARPLASGATLNSYGWNGIAIVLIPVSTLAAFSLLWLKMLGRKA